MKARYLILTILMILALMMAGCTDEKDDQTDDIIEDDDDDGDDDDPNTGNYAKHTIKELSETPYSYNGKDVEVKGAKVISIKTGYSCTISDDSTSETITLYGYDEDLGLKTGDILDVKGIFEQYKNQYWEIKIRSNTDDEIKVTGQGTVTYTTMKINELLEDKDSYIGLLVEIKDATVTSKYDSGKFNISDDSTAENLLVYIEYGVNAPNIALNDNIDISGEFVKFYNDYEIKVRKDSDDIVTVAGGGTVDTYPIHTVAELLAAPESFEDDHVQVVGAKVAWTDDDNTVSNTMFSIVDNTRGDTLTVVAFNKVASEDVDKIKPGTIVTVKGEFTFYDKDNDKVKDEDESWEIIVSSYTESDSVTIVSEGEETTYATAPSVADLLNNATNAQYRDKSVKLMGVVVVTKSSRYDYIFGVNDTAGPFNINLTVYGQAVDGLAVNDTVNVYGLFEWYAGKGYWEIKIRNSSTDKVEKV